MAAPKPQARIEVSGIYLILPVHMLGFGWAGFYLAYGGDASFCTFNGGECPANLQYLVGGFAILTYIRLYLEEFGRDKVMWMFINAGLGLLGIVSQIDWILSLFGKEFADFPVYVHVIPFLYFVLYTFLIRQFVHDVLGAREDATRRRRVDFGYVVGSVFVYLLLHFLEA